LEILGFTALAVQLVQSPAAAPAMSDADTTPKSTPPAYVQRGDAVEARRQIYKERLQQVYAALQTRVRADAPDLLPGLQAAPPRPVAHGYQILPKLVPDLPATSAAPRARSAHYSWPWTEQMIERELKKIDALVAELDRMSPMDPGRRRSACEKMVSDYLHLSEGQRTIDAHIQYNRLWQPAIARDKPVYDRLTALHDAVVERQAILDALGAADDAAFRRAVSGITGVDAGAARDALEVDLRGRERALAGEIHTATHDIAPPPFLRAEHPAPHLWILRVPFYTDIEDLDFVRSWQRAVEHVWQVRDQDDEFRVQIAMTYVSPERLYGERAECSGDRGARCVPPRKGEPIDLAAHVARFPTDGAVLTTGAISTHVTAGRCIALGPHDITPHVLAHEFGHVLGFKDIYFRGYRDLGADGYEVMEVVADPDDIMGAPGSGPVLRRHFERILADGARR